MKIPGCQAGCRAQDHLRSPWHDGPVGSLEHRFGPRLGWQSAAGHHREGVLPTRLESGSDVTFLGPQVLREIIPKWPNRSG